MPKGAKASSEQPKQNSNWAPLRRPNEAQASHGPAPRRFAARVLQGRLQLIEKAQEARLEKAEVPHLQMDQVKHIIRTLPHIHLLMYSYILMLAPPPGPTFWTEEC